MMLAIKSIPELNSLFDSGDWFMQIINKIDSPHTPNKTPAEYRRLYSDYKLFDKYNDKR
jgi:hypothetical protein